jgi:hypothetical protein
MFCRVHFDYPTHKICGYREFSPPSITNTSEPDPTSSTIVLQAVNRCPYRPASLQHVVNQHDITPRYGEGDVAWPNLGVWRRRRRIISIERNIHGAQRYLNAIGALYLSGKPHRELHPTPPDAHDGHIVGAASALKDLNGYPSHRAGDRFSVEHHLRAGTHDPVLRLRWGLGQGEASGSRS